MTEAYKFWNGRKVLVTGHTGFKGAWLCLWLAKLGAKVTAVALPPVSEPSLYGLAGPLDVAETLLDIRHQHALAAIVAEAQPEVVLHLAAQALVRASYRDPVGTFGANVMGTLHLLSALADFAPEAATLVVTSDKVYANDNAGRPFIESDPVGGHDPYSASKAATELAVSAFQAAQKAAGKPLRLATARAGNVIGGGDWAEDRLVPDLARALAAGKKIRLRNPTATRPWQHVLDPLHGYLMLAERLATAPEGLPPALNFGPDASGDGAVSTLVEALDAALGGKVGWEPDPGPHPPEAAVLALDSTLARRTLGWRPRLDRAATVRWTADWYRGWHEGISARTLCDRQLEEFMARQEIAA